ncbi:hypothetical protein A946_05290 [Methylacidiphilum kamchatkense Kam1]|uniref:Uncharacterized protein n=1 Tax=Methylacidiphilum kamchatkense Kam1 TaxID=1202785 RepID=A0A0C1URA9_9BACT|nr:hypothetical protein [Methylacidiphilum kamchatkense]KIE58824.1 hypothetical protein A946_05290 [Methylacidiphilum kamchatkense Kam1]QDQ41760.1 hypothetical protein kam1_510 [Methylacidiphilum kamchatkense Kam1]
MNFQDAFLYALENTKIILPPRRVVSTFGTTLINYQLVTEDLDRVDVCFVREGKLEAERPKIITSPQFAKLTLEGFGKEAQEYAEWLLQNAPQSSIAFLRYGFFFKKDDVCFSEVKGSSEEVCAKLKEKMIKEGDPLSLLLKGEEELWEVSLLKFLIDWVRVSVTKNIHDFRQEGFI